MQFQGVPLSYNKNVEKELRQRAPDDFRRLSEDNLEINRVKSELLNQVTPDKLIQLSELNSRQQTTRIEVAQIVKKIRRILRPTIRIIFFFTISLIICRKESWGC